jgi:hypothetical protein
MSAQLTKLLSTATAGKLATDLLLDEVEELGHAEEPDHHDQEVDAGEDIRDAEGVALDTGVGVDPDGREHEADQRADQRLHRVGADERGEAGEGEDHQRHVVGRLEGHAEARERRAEQRQQHDRDRAADEGGDGRQRERLAGLAAPGHRVAVERGHHRARVARHVEKDGRDAAAVLGAVVDTGEQDERALRRQAEAVGDRQQDRDPVDRADAGQRADQRAEEAAAKDEHEVERGEGDGEAGAEPGQDFHHGGGSFRAAATGRRAG